MASISREPGGRRTIQFVGIDGRRRSIRLGKVSQRVAEEVKVRVEHLIAAKTADLALDAETARWVAKIGDDLAGKLAAVGLIQPRVPPEAAKPVLLGDFLDGYIAGRTDLKASTRRTMETARNRLVEFFGAGKDLRAVTPGDADAFLVWLRGKYAGATAGRTVRWARQLFKAALRSRLIAENPFADLKLPGQANESRKCFVSREVTQQVLDACPDAEWRLIVALSRYGGLRCPSEHLALQLTDVDWARNRIRVRSPKTEHHPGGAERLVPLFPELYPYLREVFELAAPGTVYFVNRYRNAKVNLRTQLLRIIRRAGVTAWPKLFHNLRASRETELAAEYPIHVVCKWIGNTAQIAAKHYLQVTDADFERAAGVVQVVQNAVQQAAELSRTGPQIVNRADAEKAEVEAVRESANWCDSVQVYSMGTTGFEPVTLGV